METKDLLRKHFNGLKAERERRRAKAQPLKDEREELNKQIISLQAQADELTKQIEFELNNHGQGPDFLTLSKETSSVAKALGAVSATETR